MTFRITKNSSNGPNTYNLHAAAPGACALLGALGWNSLAAGGYSGALLSSDDAARHDQIEIEIESITDPSERYARIERSFMGSIYPADQKDGAITVYVDWEWSTDGATYRVAFHNVGGSWHGLAGHSAEYKLHSASRRCQARRYVIKALQAWLNSLTAHDLQAYHAHRDMLIESARTRRAKEARLSSLVAECAALSTKPEAEDNGRKIMNRARHITDQQLDDWIARLVVRRKELAA